MSNRLKNGMVDIDTGSDGSRCLRLARASLIPFEQTQYDELGAAVQSVRPQLRIAAQIPPFFLGFTQARIRRLSRGQTANQRERRSPSAVSSAPSQHKTV